jgi:hypothetical protein
MTFHSNANEQLTGRCKERRKIANNTWLERRDDNIAVRLHNTDILLFKPDGFVMYDSGGWLTVTTKDRMNRFGPINLSSIKGEWQAGDLPYADGLGFNPETRKWVGTPDYDDIQERRARNKQTRKEIKEWVASITPEMITHAFENPQGDCLMCRFDSDSCIASHLEERYFHAHLVRRAIAAKGYPMPDVIMSMIYSDAQRGQVSTMLTHPFGKFLRKNLLEGVAVS